MSQITVVVPIHNAGRKLSRCIRSVQDQSYKDWCLLLIDDGSTDGSLQLCESYTELDDRIRVFHQPKSGSIAARRKGIELSQSPYVTFVDADDWIDRSMLERLFNASAASNADISVCNMYRVMDSRGWIRKPYDSGYFQDEKVYLGDGIRSDLTPAFLHGHPFPVQFHGKLYKRELLLSSEAYMSRIRFFGDDLYCNLEMFLKAESVHLLPDRLYYYRAGGYTSLYMPHLFMDMVSGYQIQKEVIERYYSTEREHHHFGIKVMLLNTLRTCIKNLFMGDLSKEKRLQTIQQYCTNPEVRECAESEAAAGYFAPAYIRAIQNCDSQLLYRLGKMNYFQSLPKKILMNAASSLII